jgi:shikimate kinase
MPAAGKTTTAKWLANKLGWDFVDLDEQICAISDMSIPALFSALGEEGFRELEAKCLRETRNLQNAVISCGGGTAAYHGNMDWMKSHGLTLYLNTSFDVLVQRIAENESGRPLFQGSNKQEIMEKLVELSEKSGIRLYHENEHRIYGDSPERVADLLAQFPGKTLAAAYDAANFVFCGYCPWQGWLSCRDRVAHLHIKDWKTGEPHGTLAGQGHGRWMEVLGDSVANGYSGFATLEPHLLGGGPTGGVTGPELFPKAVECARKLILDAGGLVA